MLSAATSGGVVDLGVVDGQSGVGALRLQRVILVLAPLVVVTQPLVELIVMVVFVHLIPRLLPARIVRERHQGGWTQESTACP